MRRFLVALFASLLFHATLLIGLVALLDAATRETELPRLDVSFVQLSLSERESPSGDAALVRPVDTHPSAPPPRPAPPPPESAPPRPQLSPPSPQNEPSPSTAAPSDAPVISTAEPSLPDRPEDLPPTPQAETADSSPRQAHIEASPSPLKSIRPDYPRSARRRGREGEVLLEVRVAASGDVTDVTVVRTSGFAELDAAALRAVRSARFRPGRADGRPVGATVRLPVTFRLK